MKNVLLFAAIMTICGSTMKAPIYRMCQTELKIKYFNKGKLVFSAVRDFHTQWGNLDETHDNVTGKIFYADSMVVEPQYTTYRMLDN